MPTRVLGVTRFWPVDRINGSFLYTSLLFGAIAAQADLATVGVPHSGFGDAGCAPIRPNNVFARAFSWIFSRLPASATTFSSRSNREVLDRHLREFDPSYVVIDHIASVWALRVLDAAIHKHRKVIFCAHNAEANVRASAVRLYGLSSPLKAAANFLDRNRCSEVERLLARRCSEVICISKSDALYFNELRSANVKVLRPHVDPIDPSSFHPIERTTRQVVILGSFNWDLKRTNLERFLDVAYEHLTHNKIDIKVVGWLQDPHLSEYRRRWPLATFTGFVDEFASEVASARVGLLIDDAGGGFKLKTLDYARLGIPMFGLRTAVDAELAAQQPRCVALANSTRELTRAVVANIEKLQELERMRSHATHYINEVYTKGQSFSWIP